MQRRSLGVGRPKAGSLSVEAETAILSAALDLFAARNFAAVTTADIARATGFNTALIYYYFGTKEELFRRAVMLAVERAFERFRLSRADTRDPAGLIGEWIDTHVREFQTIAKLIKLAIDYAGTADRKAGIDRAIRTFYDEEREVLRGALAAGLKRGDFAGLDPDRTATFISIYLDGVFVRAMILEDFQQVPAIESLKVVLRQHLGGKTGRGSPRSSSGPA